MRLAMAHGMHTDMPIGALGIHAVERCRKIWWTVYILDRQMSSIQGLPQSIDDRFVQAIPPSFSGSPEKARTLGMHIKLCRSIAEISSSKCSQIPVAVTYPEDNNSSICCRWPNQPNILVEHQSSTVEYSRPRGRALRKFPTPFG